MKKYSLFSFVALFTICILSSCGSVYTYYQVCKASPLNNLDKTTAIPTGIVYSDNDCDIMYSFWSKFGNASFIFVNKTDSIIYVDLTQTFFVKGYCSYDYYKGRSWSNSSSATYATSLANTSSLYSMVPDPLKRNQNMVVSYQVARETSVVTNRTNSTSYKEADVLAVAPHSYKIVYCDYAINNERYISCEIKTYPTTKDSLVFTKDNSPLVFSNYITYRVGDSGKQKVVDNQFYISQIMNVPMSEMFRYEEIFKFSCTEENPSYSPQRYRRLVNTPCNQHFYIVYDKYSKKALYNSPGTIYYPVNDYYTR